MGDRPLTIRDEEGRRYAVSHGAGGVIRVGEREIAVSAAVDGSLVCSGDGQRIAWTAIADGVCWVAVDGEVHVFDVDRPARRRSTSAADRGPIEAPMPATVRRIAVAPGDEVRRGEVLLVLEAMKMELPIRASGDGRVEAVSCHEGELVQAGRELIRIT